ncbi:MAG: type II secretion system protein GspM [Nitrospirae bacterium]|nr:type II secretion system protein GspM [Nitrospirota bacterium]
MKRNRTLLVMLPLALILVVFIVYRYGYVKVSTEIAGIKEDQAIKTKTLEKYISLIAEKPKLEKRLAALTEERKADNAKLFEGQTLSLAAATLQDTVKGIITSRGGTISSERVGKPEEYGKLKTIGVTVDAVVPDARALSDILYSLETRAPYLLVKELDTRVRDFRNPRELMVKLDISAMTTGK